MSKKELYRDDLLNRFSGYSFVETTVGSMTQVEFQDGGSITVSESTTLVVDDAYQIIREDLVGGSEILITIDETQRDALTSPVTGTLIFNTDGTVECYSGSDWDPA